MCLSFIVVIFIAIAIYFTSFFFSRSFISIHLIHSPVTRLHTTQYQSSIFETISFRFVRAYCSVMPYEERCYRYTICELRLVFLVMSLMCVINAVCAIHTVLNRYTTNTPVISARESDVEVDRYSHLVLYIFEKYYKSFLSLFLCLCHVHGCVYSVPLHPVLPVRVLLMFTRCSPVPVSWWNNIDFQLSLTLCVNVNTVPCATQKQTHSLRTHGELCTRTCIDVVCYAYVIITCRNILNMLGAE